MRRKILVLVNPFSGRKLAREVFIRDVKPIFDLARDLIEYTVVETTHAGHAKELMGEKPHKEDVGILYDGIVCVSGDGLLSEVINGLSTRKDFLHVLSRVVVGVIPAGSGNGIAQTLGMDARTAAFFVAKGLKRKMDMYSIHQPGRPIIFGFLQVSWAIFSDVDFLSERFRWMGEMRFTVQALSSILSMQRYQGRLCYLPSEDQTKELCHFHKCPTCHEYENINATDVNDLDFSPAQHEFGQEPENWVKEEGEFTLFCCSNAPTIGANARITPHAHLCDGTMNLIYSIDKASIPELITTFLQVETGEHVHNEKIRIVRIKAMSLQPNPTNPGLIGVDGERIPSEPIKLVVHSRVLNLFGVP